MKSLTIAALFSLLAAAVAFGEDKPENTAEKLTLKAKNGDVIFSHKKHQDDLKSCQPCHTKKPEGKIEGFGKDFAHKTCKGCHEKQGKGPVKCNECHKK